MKVIELFAPVVEFCIGPRTASLVVTFRDAPEVLVAMTSWPPPETVAVVPLLNVPAVTAALMAVCRSATVELAAAVKTNVPPVEESLMTVLEPAVSAVVVASEACVEVNEFGVVDAKTFCPLKSVVWPI